MVVIMNTLISSLTLFFSGMTIWSLLSFRSTPEMKKKIRYGLIAWAIGAAMATQVYFLIAHQNSGTLFNFIATLTISLPILACDGNVSEARKGILDALYKFKNLKIWR